MRDKPITKKTTPTAMLTSQKYLNLILECFERPWRRIWLCIVMGFCGESEIEYSHKHFIQFTSIPQFLQEETQFLEVILS